MASLLYTIHQGAGAESGGIRFGENLRVDRKMGAILPYADKAEIGQIDAALISCNGLYRGKFYSKADQRTHNFSRGYLEKADKIVIVVDDYKVGKADDDEITIPGWGNGKRIIVVTDSQETKIRPHLPEHVELIVATAPT